jgi:hypothetical protein
MTIAESEEGKRMLCKPRKIFLLLVVVLGVAGRGFASTALGSVTITGAEQSSGSTWDAGTVTATINGVSVSFSYGQFTTPAGVASALGALISNNCNMQVYAHANGTTLTFYQKGSYTISSMNITSASSNPALFPGSSFLINGGGTWSPPLPTIASACVEQSSGACSISGVYGSVVTITGQNFGTSGTVTLNGMALPLLTGWGGWSNTTIYVYIPNGASSGSIEVTTSAGSAYSAFTVTGACCSL